MRKIVKFPFFLVMLICSIFAVFYTISAYSVSLSDAEDYSAYARAQSQKEQKEKVIAPYALEVAELKKNILARQAQPDIRSFKTELQRVSKDSFVEKRNNKSPILIFVSFSMPKASLKGWMTQAQRINAPIYIRGLINNSFKDTFKAVGELVEDQKGGVLIDPPLFKKYSITQVPAVVVREQDSNLFDVVYGDVTLDYALEKIVKMSSRTDSAQVVSAISMLRGDEDGKSEKNE